MLIKQKRQGEKAKPYLAQCYQYARLQSRIEEKSEIFLLEVGSEASYACRSGRKPRGKGFTSALDWCKIKTSVVFEQPRIQKSLTSDRQVNLVRPSYFELATVYHIVVYSAIGMIVFIYMSVFSKVG